MVCVEKRGLIVLLRVSGGIIIILSATLTIVGMFQRD
jgi:hypothetical protein